MLLSAVSVLVVAQSSSEIPEGLMNNPVEFYELNFPILHCFAIWPLSIFHYSTYEKISVKI